MTEGPPHDMKMPLLDHLVELRRRLIWSVASIAVLFLGCFALANPIFNLLLHPLQVVCPDCRLIYTAPQEKFFANVSVALWAAFFLGFPMLAAQVWLFVAPGLYRHEKRALLPFLLATPVLFATGAALVYFLVMPLAFTFFLGFEQTAAEGSLAIAMEPRVSEYLSLIMHLMFAFGVVFLLPVLLGLLVRAGIVTTDALRKNRRYAIVIAFVVAAVLTPPDPISQIALAVPMMLLYELGIWAGAMSEKSASHPPVE